MDCKKPYCYNCDKLVNYTRIYAEDDSDNGKNYCDECKKTKLTCCMYWYEERKKIKEKENKIHFGSARREGKMAIDREVKAYQEFVKKLFEIMEKEKNDR